MKVVLSSGCPSTPRFASGPPPHPAKPAREDKEVRFAGYAAVFDRVDQGGDVIAAGAFGRLPAAVPLLWEHRAGAPIGMVERVAQDRRGLRVIGRVSDARAARLLRDGALDGLSFGYRVTGAEGSGPRRLTGLELVEVSLVAFPMQKLARVHAIAPPAAG